MYCLSHFKSPQGLVKPGGWISETVIITVMRVIMQKLMIKRIISHIINTWRTTT